MKLLFCMKCKDVRALDLRQIVTCRCGASSGQYVDNKAAEFAGDDAYLLGFNNRSLSVAITSHINDGDHWDERGRSFSAFIIPEGAPSTVRKKEIEPND